MTNSSIIPALSIRCLALGLLVMPTSAPLVRANADAPVNPLREVYRNAVQGDMQSALPELRKLEAVQLSAKDAAMVRCMLQRFDTSTRSDGVVDLSMGPARLLEAYRDYWYPLLLHRVPSETADAALLTRINDVLASNASGLSPDKDFEATDEAVKSYFEKSGLHALTGFTAPFHELMIWREEEEVHYPVVLPEEKVDVTVVFLKNFASGGWLRYATCERVGAGGWATREKLYAVNDSYDRSTESFRVSYLAHEGQHFADYKKYPKLEQAELEYRAKLTELASSRQTTRELLRNFRGDATRGRDTPHAHAEYWVISGLQTRLFPKIARPDASAWSSVNVDDVRHAAQWLLHDSTQKLRKMGPLTTTQFLAD